MSATRTRGCGRAQRNEYRGTRSCIDADQLECARALVRGVETKRSKTKDELAALALLQRTSRSWVTLAMAGRVLNRAGPRIPHEPVRTLDAIHLAVAVVCYEAFGS